MKSTKIILILIFSISILYFKLCWAEEKVSSNAEIERVKAELFQEAAEDQEKEEYQPVWQKDFEALQRQAHDAMAQNMRLNIEHKLLEKETIKLRQEIKDRQKKNQDLRKKVDDLKELSNEKAWKAKVLAQERRSQEDLDIKNKELQEHERKIKFLEQKIVVARLKLKLMGVEDHSDKLLSLQEERDILEAKIASQTEKEKSLMEKITQVKNENKPLDPAVAGLRSEIDALRKEISGLERLHNGMIGKSGLTPQEQIKILTEQKANIETENSNLKAKVDKYRNSQKMGIENQQIKDLVEATSAVDTANGELTEEINYLRENVAILKVRVKKLEYQAEALKAIKGK